MTNSDPTRISDDQHNNAPAVPQGETERMTLDQSREYLVKFMEQHFTDKTYHRYIRGDESRHTSLAGDFAWQMARALRMLAATPAPAPAPAQGEPFGYFRAEPFGWTDCSEDAEGAIALYEHPAKPARECGNCFEGRSDMDHDCPKCGGTGFLPAQEVGLTASQFDLICQAIDKADTATMDGDYMLDSDDCIAVVRVMQALFEISALRAKGQV